MKKIPTLFKRIYDGNRVKGIIDEVLPGMEWVLAGEGNAKRGFVDSKVFKDIRIHQARNCGRWRHKIFKG